MSEHEEQRKHIQAMKYYTCPTCGQEAVLVVDVETETIPVTDEAGNTQYYCLHCHRIFSVHAHNAHGHII